MQCTENSSSLAADDSTEDLRRQHEPGIQQCNIDRLPSLLIPYLVSSSDDSRWSLCHLSSHPSLCAKTLHSARRMYLYVEFLSSVCQKNRALIHPWFRSIW